MYDHLGLQNSRHGDNKERLMEKMGKGRKALNAVAGLGFRPGGLTIKACSILFWSMAVPIATFSCELWVLKDEDIDIIEQFQRYSGRRIPRFHSRSTYETSYVGLGWIRHEYFVYIKKVMSIRIIAILDDDIIYKKVFMQRMLSYENSPDTGRMNTYNNPIWDMIRIAEVFGLFNEIRRMLMGAIVYRKYQWKEIIW